jgi:protein SCO1
MMATLKKIQQSLASRAGEFNIISISVDPVEDTPAKAKAFASIYKPGPGWYFLTGEKANVDLVLRKLGMYVERVEDHTSILIVGNVKTGLWKKVFGLGKPEDIKAVVESVLDDGGSK